MLVFSRKLDEVVVIGGGIEVTVVEVRGDKVRLGITAPKEVRVDRKEVADAIARGEPARRKGRARVVRTKTAAH